MNELQLPFDDLFIHRPQLQPGLGRHIHRWLTLLAWSAYLYLWLPIATLVLWWLGTRLGISELRRYPEFIDVELFWLLLEALGITLLLLVGWAEYNRFRFQGRDRRKHQPPVLPLATAQAMGVDALVAAGLQDARRVIVVTDQQAIPIALR